MDCLELDLPEKAEEKVKAQKMTYQELFWLFMFGSVVGYVLEGLWCILRTGAWESHSATVWGPFCIIYGFGAVAIYAFCAMLKRQNFLLHFVLFSIVGGAVEYIGSFFQEKLLGTVSWDYSNHFLNIKGRISLQMTIIWGILGIVFAKLLYPSLKNVLKKLNRRPLRWCCALLSAFMAANLLMSAAAVMRWRARITDERPAANVFEQFLDDNYNDEAMEKIYPNMRFSR